MPAGGRAHGQRVGVEPSPAGEAGIDQPIRVRRQVRRVALLRARRERLRRHHGAAQAERAVRGARGFDHAVHPWRRAARRQRHRAATPARPRARGAPAMRPSSPKAATSTSAACAVPGRLAGKPLGRAPERGDGLAVRAAPACGKRGQAPGPAAPPGRRRSPCVARRRRRASNGWCRCSAPPESSHGTHGEREARKRAERHGRQNGAVLGQAGFQQDGQAAGDQLAVVARHRDRPVGRHVEGDDGDMGGGMTRPRRRAG